MVGNSEVSHPDHEIGDHVTVLVHRAPQILLLPVDSNEDFVPVPTITEAALTPFQFAGIGDGDSAFGEKILDISAAQAETVINPDGVADDFRRETMTVIARSAVLHYDSFSPGRFSWDRDAVEIPLH